MAAVGGVRLHSGHKTLAARRRAVWARQQAALGTNRTLDNTRRALKLARRQPLVRGQHDIVPHRPGPADAANRLHRLAIGIAHPHAHHPVRRIAERPVVAPIAGSAGFRGGGPVDIEHALRAKRPHAGVAIGKYVGDQVGDLRR